MKLFCLSIKDHHFQTTFEAQYKPRRLASPGFRPSSPPARGFGYLGCWLGSTLGRTFTSWMTNTNFTEAAKPRIPK